MKDSVLCKKFKYTYSNAVLYLIAANVLVFFLCNFVNLRIYGIPLEYWMCMYPPMIQMGWVWQFVTYMFVHTDTLHLLFNMYALFMFGTFIETRLGTKEFLLFYFVCGVLGGVISYFIYLLTGVNSFILGASGAIYAILFLTAISAPGMRVMLFFFIPMKLSLAVLVFIAIEVAEQVFGANQGVAHLVHLSSIAVAYIYCLVRFRISPFKVLKETVFS